MTGARAIEQVRQRDKLSKKEMALRLGICPSYYSMLIHGQSEVSKTVAVAANQIFGIPLETLLVSAKTGTKDGG